MERTAAAIERLVTLIDRLAARLAEAERARDAACAERDRVAAALAETEAERAAEAALRAEAADALDLAIAELRAADAAARAVDGPGG